MKTIIPIVVIASMIPFYGFSQSSYSTEAYDSSNIYYKSVEELCKYIDRISPNVKSLTVERSPLDSWIPKQIGNHPIVLVSESEKKLKYLIRIVPIRSKNGLFYVNIIPFRVEKTKGKKINLVNSGALQVNFNYDCLTGSFTFSGVEGGFNRME